MSKGKNRVINTNFWNDDKVSEQFTMEDKVFWQYVLTNERTNTLGCYKLNINKASRELGFHSDTINNILKRFISYHENISYDFDTQEIFVHNYGKYNWTSSPTFKKSLLNHLEQVDSDILKELVETAINEYYGVKEVVKIMPKIIEEKDKYNPIHEIIDNYNRIFSRRLTYNNVANNKLINILLKLGFDVQMFIDVMVSKQTEWEGGDFEKYLVPSTLFAKDNFIRYASNVESGIDTKKMSGKDKFNKETKSQSQADIINSILEGVN